MGKLKQLLFSLNENDRKVIEEKLKEKDQQIDQLKQQLDESFTEEDVEGLIEDRNKTIKFLQQQLAEKDIRIAELEDKDWYEACIKQLEDQNNRLIDTLKEKDKENEELKLKLDIRAMSLQNINIERMEAVRNQTQLALQELEKAKASADKWFESWETSKYEGNIYDKLDVSNAYLQMSCEIDQQIKELKGENK